MQNLYLKILEQFKNNNHRFKELDLEPIRTVDMYSGQPDNPELFEFTAPAVFVDYNIDWEKGSAAIKRGVLNLTLHIITDPAPGTESWSHNKEEGLRRLMYYTLILELIEGVRTDNVGSLYAISEQPEKTDYFDYHTITFQAVITRPKGQPLTKLEDVKLIINTNE